MALASACPRADRATRVRPGVTLPHRGLAAKRLLIVSGKGGVGKTTVSAALAIAAARRGLDTIVAEVSGRRDVAAILGCRPAEGAEAEVSAGLHHITIDRQSALEEYLRYEIPGPLPAAILARSGALAVFINATPGMGEMLTIGKVWELTQRPRHRHHARTYDLVVLDAPASGQLVGMLAAPRTFRSIARVGSVAHQAAAVDELLTDPEAVGVVAVATGEQMAVSETIAMVSMLRERFAIESSALVVNRMFPSRFRPAEVAKLCGCDSEPALRSARWSAARSRAQRAHVARLRRGLASVPCVTLPFLFTPELGSDQLRVLGDKLAQSLV
jgi:anion-transporting  ArsA/GET3 family ATPase